jgi:hypothetical protein
MYKVVQIWPGQTVTCLHTNSPGHIWTTLYFSSLCNKIPVWFTSNHDSLGPTIFTQTAYNLDKFNVVFLGIFHGNYPA